MKQKLLLQNYWRLKAITALNPDHPQAIKKKEKKKKKSGDKPALTKTIKND